MRRKAPKGGGSWKASEAKRRAAALDQWCDMAEIAGANSELYVKATADNTAPWHESVHDALSQKAPNTLVKRVCSLWLFLRWIKLEYGKAAMAFPIDEDKVYKYVRFLRSTGAPATRAKRKVDGSGTGV